MAENNATLPLQPFMQLTQSNMELLNRFWTSPDFTAQAPGDASHWLQQAADWTTQAMRSPAYAELFVGLMKNYTEFLMLVSQSSLAAMVSAQQAMPDLTRDVNDVAEARARRSRSSSA
jgi:hypothetical protein